MIIRVVTYRFNDSLYYIVYTPTLINLDVHLRQLMVTYPISYNTFLMNCRHLLSRSYNSHQYNFVVCLFHSSHTLHLKTVKHEYIGFNWQFFTCFNLSFSEILDLVVIKSFFRGNTDDWIDRLNHNYTVTLLILFSLTVMTSQYVGDPIHCWTPAEFEGAWVAYAKSYCWIKNTYFLPINDEIPVDIATRSVGSYKFHL